MYIINEAALSPELRDALEQGRPPSFEQKALLAGLANEVERNGYIAAWARGLPLWGHNKSNDLKLAREYVGLHPIAGRATPKTSKEVWERLHLLSNGRYGKGASGALVRFSEFRTFISILRVSPEEREKTLRLSRLWAAAKSVKKTDKSISRYLVRLVKAHQELSESSWGSPSFYAAAGVVFRRLWGEDAEHRIHAALKYAIRYRYLNEWTEDRQHWIEVTPKGYALLRNRKSAKGRQGKPAGGGGVEVRGVLKNYPGKPPKIVKRKHEALCEAAVFLESWFRRGELLENSAVSVGAEQGKKWLAYLVSAGWLEKRGNGPAAEYRVKKNQ